MNPALRLFASIDVRLNDLQKLWSISVEFGLADAVTGRRAPKKKMIFAPRVKPVAAAGGVGVAGAALGSEEERETLVGWLIEQLDPDHHFDPTRPWLPVFFADRVELAIVSAMCVAALLQLGKEDFDILIESDGFGQI